MKIKTENQEDGNNNNGVLILKDNLLKEYKDKLFNIFYLWALGFKFEDDITKIKFDKSVVKNPNINEILFAYINELYDINYTFEFLKKMELFISNPESSYNIFWISLSIFIKKKIKNYQNVL